MGTPMEQKQMKNRGGRGDFFSSEPNWSRIKETQLSISRSFGREERARIRVGRRVRDSKIIVRIFCNKGKFRGLKLKGKKAKYVQKRLSEWESRQYWEKLLRKK